ncbi:unnamed protein product [Diatraea saccharalis]|nr:unnamed protein product [Diatraea saccharalis]
MPITVNIEQNIFPKYFYNSDPRYVLINVTEMTRPLYLSYECDAVNDLGSDTKRIHFREGHVPPPVRNVSAIMITATSATFYIEEAEYFQGPQIHGYVAEYDIRDNYNVTSIHDNRTWSIDWPFTINNLKPNTSYLIRFAAINVVGYSGWSDYMEFYTLEPSPPSTPIWETISELSLNNTLNISEVNQAISWRLSDNNGAPVDYYTLKYCPIDAEKSCKEQKVESDGELKADMTILEQNTTYLIELVAHNYVGYSAPANITITTPAKIIGQARLSAGALIGISVVVVFLCLLVLDLLLLLWRRQGIMATCCCRKNKNKMVSNLQTRDKKGLLKDSHDESERSRNNRPKEYEYNKTTGIITGKHSAV